jgi:hypothetical protein
LLPHAAKVRWAARHSRESIPAGPLFGGRPPSPSG